MPLPQRIVLKTPAYSSSSGTKTQPTHRRITTAPETSHCHLQLLLQGHVVHVGPSSLAGQGTLVASPCLLLRRLAISLPLKRRSGNKRTEKNAQDQGCWLLLGQGISRCMLASPAVSCDVRQGKRASSLLLSQEQRQTNKQTKAFSLTPLFFLQGQERPTQSVQIKPRTNDYWQ